MIVEHAYAIMLISKKNQNALLYKIYAGVPYFVALSRYCIILQIEGL